MGEITTPLEPIKEADIEERREELRRLLIHRKKMSKRIRFLRKYLSKNDSSS